MNAPLNPEPTYLKGKPVPLNTIAVDIGSFLFIIYFEGETSIQTLLDETDAFFA